MEDFYALRFAFPKDSGRRLEGEEKGNGQSWMRELGGKPVHTVQERSPKGAE